MKRNNTYFFITISSIALFALLIIQVNWIFQTAKIKEVLFNEKANMVLAKTAEALASDQEMCRSIEASVDTVNLLGIPSGMDQNDVAKLDSIFNHYMKYYNIHIQYSFVVAKPTFLNDQNSNGFANRIYNKRVEEANGPDGLELKLIFPDKRQYIIAEMGSLFITSVILILVVLLILWRTVLSLLNEKRVADNTRAFLNNMTHEFKTPLTNIALASKMITKDSNFQHEEKVRHYANIIIEENNKLRLQVEQVLGITALEKGEIPLRKTVLNFHDLIHEAAKTMWVQIENMKGNVLLELNATNCNVSGDMTHLTNTLYNLIDNAIKYSSGKPDLTIRTHNSNQHFVLAITDRGIGINKEYQLKVFDTFFRVPNGDLHDVKGFGLGLAYAKKIVELHGGSIELQSEWGKEQHLLLCCKMHKNRAKILLAEDDINLGLLLVDYLESEDCDIVLCKNGELALEVFLKGQFALCLLDVMMPKLDGYTLAKEIRKKDKTIPIIFLTAKSLKLDKYVGYGAGCDDYITKPFDEEELLWKIRAVLKRNSQISSEKKSEIVSIGCYTFDFDNQSLIINGKMKRITEKESAILRYLSDNRNNVIKRERMLEEIWGKNDYFLGRSLDVFITKIRKYLREDPLISIENVFSVGFIFNVPQE